MDEKQKALKYLTMRLHQGDYWAGRRGEQVEARFGVIFYIDKELGEKIKNAINIKCLVVPNKNSNTDTWTLNFYTPDVVELLRQSGAIGRRIAALHGLQL